MTTTRKTIALALLFAVAGLQAVSAQASTTDYGLRHFGFATGFGPGIAPPEPSPVEFSDSFYNGDPLTGATKSLGGVTTAASYSVTNNGFSANAETRPNDWAGLQFDIGRLALRAGDARDVPNNLTPAGMLSLTNRLTVADVAGSSLLTRTSSFEVGAFYDFATPDAGSYYGLRLSDNPGGSNASYNDLLDLRVTRGGDDLPRLNLRRLTSAGGILASTSLANYNLSSALPAGKTLADVGYIGFELHYNYFGDGHAGNGVTAAFELIDTQGNDLMRLQVNDSFGNMLIVPLFNGEDFTRASVGANWTLAPVPEPTTYAMLAMGLAVVGLARRRQRRA